MTNLWWDIQPISAGLFGVPLGFLVIILVSLVTPAPDRKTQELVEHVRYPSFGAPERASREGEGDRRVAPFSFVYQALEGQVPEASAVYPRPGGMDE